MKKNLRTIKTALIMGMLLFSVFAALMPAISAEGLVNLSHTLNVEWDSGNKTELLDPSGQMKSYNLNVRYQVIGGPIGQIFYRLYDGRPVTIKLEIWKRLR